MGSTVLSRGQFKAPTLIYFFKVSSEAKYFSSCLLNMQQASEDHRPQLKAGNVTETVSSARAPWLCLKGCHMAGRQPSSEKQ